MSPDPVPSRVPLPATLAVWLAAALGLMLQVDQALRNSATYDEITYLEVGADWWRHGHQDRIARMGSPLTFWKIQQAPVLFALDRGGFGALIDEPEPHQAVLLPLVRIGSLWVWLAALLLTAGWVRDELGPWPMAVAAWLFALSPNLLAHGALCTMEMPLVAATAGQLWFFTRYLRSGRSSWLVASAILGGLAFSLKFTEIVIPPLLILGWGLEQLRSGAGWRRVLPQAFLRLATFLVLLAMANVAITGGALLPLSERAGSHPAFESRLGPRVGRFIGALAEVPLPQDAVAFAKQMEHQRSGGPGYLRGERRMRGWWYYYFVAILLKVPVLVTIAFVTRLLLLRRPAAAPGERLGRVLVLGFLLLTALGSSRNYGLRYLLPVAPAVLIGIAALTRAGRAGHLVVAATLAGQAASVLMTHPAELSYFNVAAGGPEGGKHWLSDSNLDWGQGAKSVARLQQRRPEFCDLTYFAFGNTDPSHYGVRGRVFLIDAHGPRVSLPSWDTLDTRFVAVSRSLQYGPWGPPGHFEALSRSRPVEISDDHTVSFYDTSEFSRPGIRTSN